MNGFYSFILAFCTVCVVLGGLSVIIPSGSFAKPLQYIFCLVFICVIIGSVFSIDKVNFNIVSGSEETTVSENGAEMLARQTFEEALRRAGIKFEKIKVFTDKSESGGIFITEVVVYSHESFSKINEIISSDGAYEVRVINE